MPICPLSWMKLMGVLLMTMPLAASQLAAQGQERSQFAPDYDPRASLRAHRPAVPGTRALVTSAHPLASMAGMDILMKGGNAFDAAVAVAATPAFAQLQTTRVQGTVVDDGGRPVPGIGVALVDPLGATLRTATTDDAGHFVLADVPAGRFAVRTDHAGGAPVLVPLTIETALPVDVTVRLPPRLAESIRVDAVATLPGWATEDNGLLHARGADDGFLYVIDGIPVHVCDQRYAFNFGNPFSGTHFGAPRTASVSLQVTLR